MNIKSRVTLATLCLTLLLPHSAFAQHKGIWPTTAPWIASPRMGLEAGASIQKHQALMAESKNRHPKVLFFGDSITANWMSSGLQQWNKYFAPLDSFDIGISGDTTQSSLWRIEQGALSNMTPQTVVLLIGTNNINTSSRAEAALGIIYVVGSIQRRLPQAKILLLGLLPRDLGASTQPLRQKVRDVNSILEKFQSDRVHYVDIGGALLQPDGAISAQLAPDGLHPSAAGYEKLAPLIVSAIQNLNHQ